MAKKVYSRDIILKTAYALSFEKGMEHITIRQIAKELGCSVMPIYESFDSKEDLINELSTFNEEKYIDKDETMYDRYYRLLREGIKYPNFYLSVADYDVRKRHNENIIDHVCMIVKKHEKLKHLSDYYAFQCNTRIEIFILGMVYVYKDLPDARKADDKMISILNNCIDAFIEYYSKF